MAVKRQDLTFRVFVSSTFSDMVSERNALQEKVFPELRRYCQERGARFQAIDLRWGVSEEAAIDQQTMNICLTELKRCQEVSPRPNFIVLLGDRYGWRPLPPQIDADEFDALKERLSASEQQRILKWYRLDENAVPPEYCLLSRTGEFIDYVRWTKEEVELREILLRAVEQVMPPDAPGRWKYYDSATHQEIRSGALTANAPQAHVFCYFRDIDGLPEDDSARKYRDILVHDADQEAQNRLIALKEELKRLLPREHVHEFHAVWAEGHPEWNRDAFCEDVKLDLKKVIDQEVNAFKQREEQDREAEAQWEFADERCRHFMGRQDVLKHIEDYLTSDDKIPLIIHGRSGSGKTALMAEAALEMERSTLNDLRTSVVSCFIGATPASCNLRSLLTFLCRRLGVINIPSDMNELVKTFRNRLAPEGESQTDSRERQPVVLFLDALDQLNPTDNARMLYWLPRTLASDVKLVLSVLQTKQPADQTKPSIREDCFDIAGRIWPGHMLELGNLDEDSGTRLMENWLTDTHRTLQPLQLDHVLGKFRACPLPLYLKLAFEEVRRWKSWTPPPPGVLGNSVEAILNDLFRRLEEPRNHGPLLISRAMGYIAAGKNGLTEDELLDVLSTDKEVMEWFYGQSPTERVKAANDRIKVLPVVIWSRLFMDFESYMTRRRADGTVVMDFYHRQVGEEVYSRYLTGDARVKAHLHLAEYFHQQDYWAESLETQQARAKRLPPTPRPANVRKVVELPYHRLEVAKLAGKDDARSPHWDALADLLTDWQFLEAKAEADPDFSEQESHEPSPLGEEAKP